MKTYVVDACVLAKVVIQDQEEDCDKALALFHQFMERNVNLLVPSFWAFELGNTIRKRIQGLAHQTTALQYLFQAQLITVDFTESDYLHILDFFDGQSVTFYDASYYYIAKREDIPLITADEKFAKRMNDKERIILLRELEI